MYMYNHVHVQLHMFTCTCVCVYTRMYMEIHSLPMGELTPLTLFGVRSDCAKLYFRLASTCSLTSYMYRYPEAVAIQRHESNGRIDVIRSLLIS